MRVSRLPQILLGLATLCVTLTSGLSLKGEPASVPDRVKKVVAAVLGVGEERVLPDARLREDLGAILTDVKEILLALEEEFGIELPPPEEQEASIITVSDAIRLVESHLGDPN